ncbi:hypothetical protein OG339_35480 [Streptosporangium sp. NBC_01495]|uniref:hypothetical protein n=1 Tax=Streptosporangium sp. NBC_01495 TaxID=2903899 RepID=UPI002E2F2127|nr:hypothetical protein [Streptosporangium sp. NBC_01495]
MTPYAADAADALLTARERVRRLEQLTSRRGAVAVQLDEVAALLGDLEDLLAKEEEDVSKLEGGGFSALLAGLTGSRDERLARERAEVLAVRQRLDGQRNRLEWLNADRAAVDEGLAGLGPAREEYDALLEREERRLVASGDSRGRELVELDQRLADTRADLAEYQEAHRAGVDAFHGVGEVLRCLGGARGASTWDMLAGGGGFADMMEHGHLRNADEAAWHAQQLLDTFARELVDIGVNVAPKLPEVDTRWFADMFFDNIITDAIKHHRIESTGAAVADVAEWVRRTVEGLDVRREELTRLRDALAARREEVIVTG